jgi:hypothetical protein
MFELTMLQCMFERKHRRSHQDATEEQLNALKAGYAPSFHFPSQDIVSCYRF